MSKAAKDANVILTVTTHVKQNNITFTDGSALVVFLWEMVFWELEANNDKNKKKFCEVLIS